MPRDLVITKRRPSAETRRPATKPVKAAARNRGAREIFEALRTRIAQQQIAPGAKLRETDLAEEFGVPRTRVRDAISLLEQRGLVERIPNRGALVMRMDVSQLVHIYDVREVLEALCARLATERMPGEYWCEDLELFEGRMKELVEAGDFDGYIAQYERMRRRIIEAAGNPLLAEMLDTIYEKTQVLIRRIIILPGRAETGRQQHIAMLKAMIAGQAEEAERLRRAGLRSAKSALEKYQRYIL